MQTVKTVEIDFVRENNESTEHAVESMRRGHRVRIDVTKETGDSGHPVAKVTGLAAHLVKFLQAHGYDPSDYDL